jgi:hypothetical protein
LAATVPTLSWLERAVAVVSFTVRVSEDRCLEENGFGFFDSGLAVTLLSSGLDHDTVSAFPAKDDTGSRLPVSCGCIYHFRTDNLHRSFPIEFGRPPQCGVF